MLVGQVNAQELKDKRYWDNAGSFMFSMGHRVCYYCNRNEDEDDNFQPRSEVEGKLKFALLTVSFKTKGNGGAHSARSKLIKDVTTTINSPSRFDVATPSCDEEVKLASAVPSFKSLICVDCQSELEDITIRFTNPTFSESFRIQKHPISEGSRLRHSGLQDRYLTHKELFRILSYNPIVDQPKLEQLVNADFNLLDIATLVLEQAMIDNSPIDPTQMANWLISDELFTDTSIDTSMYLGDEEHEIWIPSSVEKLQMVEGLAKRNQQLVEMIQVHLPRDLALLVAEYHSHSHNFLKAVTRAVNIATRSTMVANHVNDVKSVK